MAMHPRTSESPPAHFCPAFPGLLKYEPAPFSLSSYDRVRESEVLRPPVKTEAKEFIDGVQASKEP